MSLIIRDDDINYFTKKAELEILYNKLWDNGVKVCFSVIPMLNSNTRPEEKYTKMGFEFDPMIPKEFAGSGFYSIEKNKNLCKFLNRKVDEDLVEISIHGLSHGRNPVPEFECSDREYLEKKLEKGIEIMKEVFPNAEIGCFVAPYGNISVEARKMLIENSFNICVDESGFLTTDFVKVGDNFIFQKSNFIFNPVLGNRSASQCSSDATAFLKKRKGFAIIANHCWEFGIAKERKKLLEYWDEFCEMLLESKPDFVSFNSFRGIQ